MSDEMQTERKLSYGELAVSHFQADVDPGVERIKGIYAELIDLLNDARTTVGPGEKGRLLSVAITEAQTAQMWAVKAITWKQ